MFKAYIVKWSVWTLEYNNIEDLKKDIQIFNSDCDIFHNGIYIESY